MGGFIADSGTTVLCMATGNMFGKTEKVFRANLVLIKSMVTGFIPGQMDVFTEDTGEMVNSMGLQSIA